MHTSRINMDNYDKLNYKMSSLQSLCLNSVVRHFQRFHFAFTASKDPRLQRNREFLQRRFSNELACALLEDGKKTDVYFNFLINEHLTVVDFHWFEYSQYLNSIHCIFIRVPNLVKIRFNFRGDEILENITKFCPKLVEIDASNSDVSDKGIKHLVEMRNGRLPCPELKYIAALSSLVSDEGAEGLIRNLPLLEIFGYENLPYLLHSIYTKKVFQNQQVLPLSLTELHISGDKDVSYFTDVLKTCLTVCPKLQSVRWFYLRQEEQLDAMINSHVRLKKLCLWLTLTNINIDNYLKAGGCNITYLRISNCSLSASVLAEHCPELKELHIFDVDFMDADDVQPSFPSLTSCNFFIENLSVVKAFRLLFSSSPNLDTVKLGWSTESAERTVNSDMKNHILMWCKSPTAKHIKFDNVPIEMNFLKGIFLTCVSLKWIDLWFCKFDVDYPDEILNFLAKKHPNRPIIDLYASHYRTFINEECHFPANQRISDFIWF